MFPEPMPGNETSSVEVLTSSYTNATDTYTNATDTYTNATDVSANQTDSEITFDPLPNATEVWDFGDQNIQNVTIVGNVTYVDEGTNGTAYSFGGDEYLQTDSTNATTYISDMTISAWVKPDYSSGSSVFSVVSKSESFGLSINNVISPEQIAVFSVFDGIKWTSVQSYSTIPEQWTHLTASFNQTTITIYVNGILEASESLDAIPYVSVDGQICRPDGGSADTIRAARS